VPTGTFAAILASVGLLVVLQVGWCLLRYKRRKSDEVWHVNHEELDFSHPVEVIGQGAFGVVLLADYRGTKVAIKRVLPLQPKAKVRGTGSVASVPSNKSVPDLVEANSDPEGGTQSAGSSRRECINTGGDESSSAGFDFLGTMSRRQKGLQRWLPSFFSGNATRSNLSILGTASGGSTTTKSWLGMIFPRCDENSRRQEEFLTEMRLLSRLRHPCEYYACFITPFILRPLPHNSLLTSLFSFQVLRQSWVLL
jgi:serine/threonine protein kinase